MKLEKLIGFHLIGNTILMATLLLTALIALDKPYALFLAVPLLIFLGFFLHLANYKSISDAFYLRFQ